MVTETRYMRNAGHTVNGLTAGELETNQTITAASAYADASGACTVYWAYDVIKRTSAGAETVIGSKVGQVNRNTDGSGEQSATWDCPKTTLASTDAIHIHAYIKMGGGSWVAAEYTGGWITEQLGAALLSAATWTFCTHTYRAYDEELDYTEARISWGDANVDTRIEGFAWATAEPVAYTVTITETLGMIDTVAKARSQKVTVIDVLGMEDSVGKKASFKQIITDILGMLDSATRSFPLKVTISEVLGLRDRIESRKHTSVIGDLPDNTITGGA